MQVRFLPGAQNRAQRDFVLPRKPRCSFRAGIEKVLPFLFIVEIFSLVCYNDLVLERVNEVGFLYKTKS